MARRVRAGADAPDSGAGAAAPAGPAPRRALPRRIAVRLYLLTRPVALPLARRLHRLLGRLLEKEAVLSERDAASGPAPATADLLRSIEAAMLTLALQRRGENS